MLQLHFREGEEVRAGQLLFTLDASEAEAQLARVPAGAANAQAQVQEATREHGRAVELGRANFISVSAIGWRTQMKPKSFSDSPLSLVRKT